MSVRKKGGLLAGTAAYLSGPMDFVASRAEEKERGWRTRVGDFLRKLGVTVYDPWEKPEVRGFQQYGTEGVGTPEEIRKNWTFKPGAAGSKARAHCSREFWSSMHIDLRMVDKSDFVIAYCPTNVYSVGTVHEIVTARIQRKPVLFVSPRVEFPALTQLKAHLQDDPAGTALLQQLENQVPIRPNPEAIPSLWYLPLIGIHRFFDGFGFAGYASRFGWDTSVGPQERGKLQRPLLRYLEELSRSKAPKRYDARVGRNVIDDDWLIWTPPPLPAARVPPPASRTRRP